MTGPPIGCRSPRPRPNRGGKPGHSSPLLAARNRDWLELQESAGWTVARIARHVHRSTRAVRAALASARALRSRGEVSDEELTRLREYIAANPSYEDDAEVQEWVRKGPHGARPAPDQHEKDPPAGRRQVIPVVRPWQALRARPVGGRFGSG